MPTTAFHSVDENSPRRAVAERTQRQWLGDGSTPEGEGEWLAQLRSLDD